ncbi:Zn-dependent hydrolase [Microbacterium marinilacus]|uniref:Zn-dependent hydrolase n=1 Tax=Microbacterium marinilacus TaxID=415209 RepID=A0ABP7BWM8_9MICO|nr:Zn-dependent hydrolase [Microbacterium marinilacus]MBY0688235.1 Zn-dependent hydrolase [Microbacterium marinilacus]
MNAADARAVGELLDDFARLTEPGPGVTRLAYSPLEREAHARFAERMQALGCAIRVDEAGNTIAELPGTDPDARAIGTGSHLDSVYEGGRFDGVAGVVAGMELVRLLVEGGEPLTHPVRVVAFAGEEGARFGQACLGSRFAAGLTPRPLVDELVDRDGIPLADAMRALGFDADRAATARWDPSEWAVFLELHIEQGRVLQDSGAALGPVDSISGSTRLSFTLHGRPSHTGGTPMAGRADALAAAAEAVLTAEQLATDHAHRGTRATVGRLEVSPNSITTIPGRVTFSLDVRDVDADRQRSATTEIVSRVMATARRRGVGVDVRLIADTSPVILPLWVRNALVQAAVSGGSSYRVLSSGASHDAQMINTIVPTGMLFVPSRDGLSHVPEEWTDASEIAVGVDALVAAVRALDAQLAAARDERVAAGR